MDQTIPAMFQEQAARWGGWPLFHVKRSGRYEPIRWDAAFRTVESLAAALLDLHVAVGDRVLLLSENRPEWGLADLAIQSIGAWTVPIYPSLTEQEVLAICRNCEPVIAIVSTAEQLAKVRVVRQQLGSLRTVIAVCAEELQPAGEQSWTQAIEQGSQRLGALRATLDQRRRALAPDDVATLIYTSGTTGEPKGVMLSHHNFLSNAAACCQALPIGPDDLHLSFLPLSHVFERMAGWYLMLTVGASVGYAESMDTIAQNMLELRPTVMLGVPRFFEKLYRRVQANLEQSSPIKRRIAVWAFAVHHRLNQLTRAHARPSLGLRLRHLIAQRLVLHKLHARLGGRLKFFVSGSAPLARTIAEFFDDAGILILEGYGLTETSPVIAVNRLEAVKFGTVGLPLDGVEVRLAEDGEILTRGPHVMQGYFRKPLETQTALADGWFHTGDIGALDPDGFLTITDRKKDLIKTAGGKFVAPQKLENLFITDPYIAQAFVFGDRERFCVALIRPHVGRVQEYASQCGITCGSDHELLARPEIHQLLWSRVQALQCRLPSFEQVKAIGLLDRELTQEAGELTPTLKAKRSLIAARYEPLLRRLYDTTTRSD